MIASRTQLPYGIGVDSRGSPTIDPTENVKSLMEASIKSLTREAELQASLSDAKIQRLEQEAVHQEKMSIQRAEFDKEIRRMESDRIDKIRSVDVSNAAATATQLLAAVNNYAAAQERTAQTLRDQVSSTAQAASTAQGALINPLADRVATLEKSSYTGAGKSAVTDPAVVEMASELKRLSATLIEREGRHAATDPMLTAAMTDIRALLAVQANEAGKGSGLHIAWVVLGGIVSILVGLLLIGSFAFGGTKVTPSSSVPQIIYVPTPAAGNPAPLPGTIR